MILKILIKIYLLVNSINCIIHYEIHSSELSIKESTEFINQSLASTDCTNKLCENCGINSERCVFDQIKCTIKCECKIDYIGIFCNETSLKNLPTSTTIKYRFVDDFVNLKEKAWIDISKSMNEIEFRAGNIDFIEGVIHKLRRLFEILFIQGKLEVSDVLNYKSFIESICQQSPKKFFLSENSIENLYYVMDNIIYLNGLISNKNDEKGMTIFEQLNYNHYNSGLVMLNYFERLSKYFQLSSYSMKKNFKFKNFDSLIQISTPPNHVKAEFYAVNNQLKNINLIDSIELNELVLRKLFQNQTIKMSFYIFFNQKQTKFDHKDGLNFFNEQINSKLKAKNFIYEITNSIIKNESKKSMIENSYFVSSNVISAEIHNKIDLKLRDSISIDELNKFVRIQFLIDLNELENLNNMNNDDFELNNQLKCVFWNESSMKWSSNGCRKSLKESHFVLMDNNHENKYFLKVCYCNHLTNFALLFDPFNQYDLDETNSFYYDEDSKGAFLNNTYLIVNKYILKYLTLIGIIISSICYLILIICRLEFINRKITRYKDTSSSQINSSSSTKISTLFSSSSLSRSSYIHSNAYKYKDETLRLLYLSNSICLLISNVLFLLNFLVKPSSIRAVRKLNASLLHYFLLVSFCFSLGIAWQHFNKLVRVFSQHNTLSNNNKRCFLLFFNQSNFFAKCLLLSLFFPCVFALYGYQYLFMFDQGFYWFTTPYLYYLFVGPLITLLIISLIFYVFVSIKVISVYRENINPDISRVSMNGHSSYNQKTVIVLLTFSFITLGLTWLIGIFIIIASNYTTNKYLKLFIDFLFCLLNSFHGLSLLIGNYLARKYGKQATIDTHNVKKSILKNKTNNDDNTNNIRLSLMTRFYVQYYKFINLFVKKTNNDQSKVENLQKEPYIEFTIYNDNNNSIDQKSKKTKRVLFKNFESYQTPKVTLPKSSISKSCENILNQINIDIKKYLDSNKINKSNQEHFRKSNNIKDDDIQI